MSPMRSEKVKLKSQAKWIRCIFELLNAQSHAVKYEAAISLTTLTQNPAAVKGQLNRDHRYFKQLTF